MSRDLDNILQAAADEPYEMLHRHVLADWCEEHGDGMRATFVRLSLSNPEDKRLLRIFERYCCQWWPSGWFYHESFHFMVRSRQFAAKPRNGLLEEIECNFEAWHTQGHTVVKRHPVTQLRVLGKSPNGAQWFCGDAEHESYLPKAVYEEVRKFAQYSNSASATFGSVGTALDALNVAMLQLARVKRWSNG